MRDLLFHRENMDLDLVLEGDGIRFAEEFARETGGEVAAHPRFGTARVTFADGFKVDVATARTESYHAPAALPQVQGGILRQDLYRRDFTFNTLAIDLSPNTFRNARGLFRGLGRSAPGHDPRSSQPEFIDDPTRTIRAIRFATRFNFQISKDTKRLLTGAVDSRVLEKLSGKRFWAELRNLLNEEHPIPGLRLMHHFRLLPFVHPSLTLDTFFLDLLYQVQGVLSWFHLNFPNETVKGWKMYLMAMLEKLTRHERLAIGQHYQLTSDVQDLLRYYKSNTRDIFTRLRSEPRAPSLYFSLREYPLEILLYAMARIEEEPYKQLIATFLRDLRKVKLEINGDDLLQLGLPRGPAIREILDEVLRRRLDGTAQDREAQLAAARDVIRLAETDPASGKTGEPHA